MRLVGACGARHISMTGYVGLQDRQRLDGADAVRTLFTASTSIPLWAENSKEIGWQAMWPATRFNHALATSFNRLPSLSWLRSPKESPSPSSLHELP